MKVTRSRLRDLLSKANARLQGEALKLDELCEMISGKSAQELINDFKQTLKGKKNVEKKELKRLICVLWVLHDLSLISFTRKVNGLAIAIQEMLLQGKKVIASQLMEVLEETFEHVSDEKVEII